MHAADTRQDYANALKAMKRDLHKRTKSFENVKEDEDPELIALRYFTYTFPNLLCRTWDMMEQHNDGLEEFYPSRAKK